MSNYFRHQHQTNYREDTGLEGNVISSDEIISGISTLHRYTDHLPQNFLDTDTSGIRSSNFNVDRQQQEIQSHSADHIDTQNHSDMITSMPCSQVTAFDFSHVLKLLASNMAHNRSTETCTNTTTNTATNESYGIRSLNDTSLDPSSISLGMEGTHLYFNSALANLPPDTPLTTPTGLNPAPIPSEPFHANTNTNINTIENMQDYRSDLRGMNNYNDTTPFRSKPSTMSLKGLEPTMLSNPAGPAPVTPCMSVPSKMTTANRKLSMGLSIEEVERILNGSLQRRKSSLHCRRSSVTGLEPLLSAIKSNSSFSSLLQRQEQGYDLSNVMEKEDMANAAFNTSNLINENNFDVPSHPDSNPLLGLLTRFSELEQQGKEIEVTTDMNNNMNVSYHQFHHSPEPKPNDEIAMNRSVSSSSCPRPTNTVAINKTSTPISSSIASPLPPDSVNPLDSKSPFFDISFATKYQTNLKALVSLMERSSKSRRGFQEVKRQFSKNKEGNNEGQKVKQENQLEEADPGRTTPSIRTECDQYYQQSQPISYTKIKSSRRQRGKKKKLVPTKSNEVKMQKYRFKSSNHRRSLSLKHCTPEMIFG